MPSGLPNSSALSSRKVCAFSLDTSVVEAAGFRFREGALRHLSGQLPPWLHLWMPDIVVREISQHRLDNVYRSIQAIQTGIQDLRRHMGSEFREADPAWLHTSRSTAIDAFDQQLMHFLRSHNGVILEPTHTRLSVEVFDRYFQNRPPFGGGKDKKHEFPDATALVMLDFKAAEQGGQVIVVSKDSGWAAYAAQSPHIYCVSSLTELTALFTSQSPEAREVKTRLSNALKTRSLELERTTKAAIENGLMSLPWRIYPPRSNRYEFDAGVFETKLRSFDIHGDAIGVWVTSNTHDACVAEMPVDIDVSLHVEVVATCRGEFGEKTDVATVKAIVEQRLEVKLQIELAGALKTDSIEDLIKNISISDTPIAVHLSRADLGPNWIPVEKSTRWWGGFDDQDDDDMPF